MKLPIKKLTSAALMLLVALTSTPFYSSCTDDDHSQTEGGESLTDQEKAQLLERAYVYTLPLMFVEATFVKMTNTVEPTTQQGPANCFIHARKLANATSRDVVTPNSDTNYSQIMMDLSSDALVVRLPKTDRFCMAEILDAWSNCIAAPDATTIEGDSGYFVFTGPNFTDTVPSGMTTIECPTNHVWMLLRTLCKGENDLDSVHMIQDAMRTYLLSDFIQSPENEYHGKGTFDPANNYTPVDHVMSLSMADYFTQANALMVNNPPAAADEPWLDDLKKIGVGPGLTFDASIFGEQASELWNQLVANIIPITKESSMQFVQTNGYWNFYGEPIAEFGTEYYYRAMIAVAALAANPVSIAVYPRTNQDSEGKLLDCSNGQKYVLHLEKDNWPDTKDYGFWSITMYEEDNFFYNNDLNRYNITDRSQLIPNEDGSVDIYIQHDAVADSLMNNWLPAPSDKFHLYFRIYNPVERVSKNQWTMPSIRKL